METKKETRKELIERLNKVKHEIWEKRFSYRQSPEYKNLEKEEDILDEEEQRIKTRLNDDVEELGNKYIRWGWNVHAFWNNYGIRKEDIRPPVRDGIKRGLGVKYIKDIPDEYFSKVVTQMIRYELEKRTPNLIAKLKVCENRINEIQNKKTEIEDVISKEVQTLLDEEKEIYTKLKSSDAQDATRKIIDEKLPELMESIVNEVRRSFVLNGITK